MIRHIPLQRVFVRRVRRSRRGAYAIIVALSLVVMLGFAALAIDFSYLRLAQMQAQNAADAGAHAALVELRNTRDQDDARIVAQEVAGMNHVAGEPAQIDPDRDVTFGGWDFLSKSFDPDADYVNAVQVTVRRDDDSPGGPVDLMLARIFGADSASATSTGESVSALRFREVVVVQDITGSFMDEIDEAREADLVLLDYMYDNGFPRDRVGMATFVGAAEVWTPLTLLETGYDSVRAQWTTLDWCDRSYAPWDGYDGGAFYHAAPDMQGCNEGSTADAWYWDSGTNQGTGLEAALSILLDEDSASAYALKTIVLVSDGKPQCVPEEPACDAAVAAYGTAMADWAAENKVSIFSVSFNDSYDAVQSAYMESLIRGYGAFYETPDESELPEILEEIAASIPISIVQ